MSNHNSDSLIHQQTDRTVEDKFAHSEKGNNWYYPQDMERKPNIQTVRLLVENHKYPCTQQLKTTKTHATGVTNGWTNCHSQCTAKVDVTSKSSEIKFLQIAGHLLVSIFFHKREDNMTMHKHKVNKMWKITERVT